MTGLNSLQRIQQAETPTVVDVGAAWCAPCRMIEPALESLADEYRGRVELVRLNADAEPELVQALGVAGIPTLIAFGGGQEIVRRTGAAPRDVLAGLFEAAFSGTVPLPTGLTALDRVARLAAGLAVIALSLRGGWAWLFAPIGAIILFSAVHDRCPIWRTIRARLAGVARQPSESAPAGEGQA